MDHRDEVRHRDGVRLDQDDLERYRVLGDGHRGAAELGDQSETWGDRGAVELGGPSATLAALDLRPHLGVELGESFVGRLGLACAVPLA